jgi:predicted neuraminidase
MRYRTALAFAFLASIVTAEEEWNLQPLKYNHPGLVVDLGVGLWAWPLPMDYDEDGDLDLLVSCPDKPSNGIYFFENPSQDPSVKQPVFKPGVRIGPTGQNMQVSYVDGHPRILRENVELVDFKTKGFEKETTIYENARIHPGNTRARPWRYVDWEGDGDQDLAVGIGDWNDYVWDHAYDAHGRWRNGPLHGWVYLIENQGGAYSDNPVKILAGGSAVDVFGWPSPNFSDFDGDGDLDLLCGEFLDGFTYFENIGDRAKPEYATGFKLTGDDGEPLVMHLQMITPTAIDWDADGDHDLVVGDEDGRVALIENVSPENTRLPSFKQPVYFQQEADTLKFGALATPFAYDWDGDGDEDILCGNTAGSIGFFENLGDADGLPMWAAPSLLQVDGKTFRILAGESGSIQGPAEAKWGYTTLSVADWNEDNKADIIVNSIWAKLTLLRNTGAGLTQEPLPFWTKESPPAFYWWQTVAENLQTQWRTTPLATDFDNDGKLDLVILDQEGYLTCQSRKTEETRIFIDEDNRPIRLNSRTAGRSGRYKLAVTDWDGDGRLDVLVNSENAAWYRNCEDRDGKIVLKKVGNLAKRNVSGHTSSPAVCDFNRDGKPDLLVGSENGRIYHITHDDAVQFGDDQTVARPARKPERPRFPGLVTEEFISSKTAFTKCHISTITENSRGLVAAWIGAKDEDSDGGIWVSYHDGGGWSSAKEVANGIQHNDLRYPMGAPVLFQPPGDAPTMLFYKVGPSPREYWGEVMLSYDRGRSFRDRRRLPEGIVGPIRSQPILFEDGAMVAGASTENDGWKIHFERTTDLGKSWQRIGPIESNAFQAILPTLLVHPDGRLQALCRTSEGEIATTHSLDRGHTWSPLEGTGLPNSNSGFAALTLADGRHFLLHNHIGIADGRWGRRGMLNLAVSEDGRNWKAAATIEQEEKSEFGYPAMIQGNDGLVHMTYTWKHQRIKHLVVDPAKLDLKPIEWFEE